MPVVQEDTLTLCAESLETCDDIIFWRESVDDPSPD